MFFKHIVLSKGSPMAIKHYCYKVEFALTGAGHIHGVLWVDWEKCHAVPKIDITNITSSATAEIDDGPCGASTLSSWRSESSNISLVVLDKLLF